MRSGTELSQFLRIFPTYSCMLKDFFNQFYAGVLYVGYRANAEKRNCADDRICFHNR